MSKLTLFRHGQGVERLTDLGETQARKLGEYLATHGMTFDQAIVGSLERQRRTAQLVAEAYAARDLPFPELEQDDDWDEYEAGPIIKHIAEQLEKSDPQFAKLSQALRDATGTAEQPRRFQHFFEAVMLAWTEGRESAEGMQTFEDFHAGVMAARGRIMAGPSGRSVAVFTSGGPIGVNVGAAVGAPSGEAVRINWRVRNASITEFTFSKARIAVDTFNGLPHFVDAPELVTFR